MVNNLSPFGERWSVSLLKSFIEAFALLRFAPHSELLLQISPNLSSNSVDQYPCQGINALSSAVPPLNTQILEAHPKVDPLNLCAPPHSIRTTLFKPFYAIIKYAVSNSSAFSQVERNSQLQYLFGFCENLSTLVLENLPLNLKMKVLKPNST